MDTLRTYVLRFFQDLEVQEDAARGHNYKPYMKGAILAFLDNETKDNAFGVYRAFFDSYRIVLEGESNPFVDLLDMLRAYEENASVLIDKQRDHYIHSVNVFLLGLAIYIGNARYRKAFQDSMAQPLNGKPFFPTYNEEFYYRWGLAALFHDVGYPVEIIAKQLNQFIQFASEVDGNKTKINAHLSFDNFQELNTIAEVVPKRRFTSSYYDAHETCVYVDLLKPIDLLAHKIHITLGVDVRQVKQDLDDFVDKMAVSGFVDHGYYSALIVLKWYGYLIQQTGGVPDRFFYQVLDSASAILLHNFYRNVLMKPPYNLKALKPEKHPLAYLMMLSDELQEWNREAYGIQDKKRAHAGSAEVLVTDDALALTYISYHCELPDGFGAQKEQFLRSLLKVDALFPGGLTVACRSEGEQAPRGPLKAEGYRPRPLLENMEKLAVAIHDRYNKLQKEQHPDQPLAYPTFADLPDDMKYSNMRQAIQIPEKLALVGYEMAPAGDPRPAISTFDQEVLEYLATVEHDDWMREREESGWVYGKEKDVEGKLTPWMVPYDKLPDEIQEYDRNAIRTIPELLQMIGMVMVDGNA